TLIHGECRTCPVGSPEVPERLLDVRDETARLRQATGRPAEITVRPAVPEDGERSQKLTRRGAFSALLRAGGQQLAQRLPERPLPFVDWSEPEQRTPAEWQWRKKSLGTPLPSGAIDWPAPLVDDSCIDCPVCANVCPTQAITRDLQPEGGVRLLLDLSACTGCMACLRSCPPQAIHEQGQWLAPAFDLPVLLRESDRVM
ncbi:MAG: 4Fe-4S binding protein, partial [Deinococcus sp.]|uniref:4Fe-4S dicluster domain-containing protein n=1 Tax=Deinococcus sp. TaxID=47478 RepID=UPI0026DC163A